jgi:hypothetical protein
VAAAVAVSVGAAAVPLLFATAPVAAAIVRRRAPRNGFVFCLFSSRSPPPANSNSPAGGLDFFRRVTAGK